MSTTNFLTSNFNNKCRICLQLQPESQMNPFFNVYFEGLSLAKVFTNITSYEVQEDDRLPKKICEACKSNLITFNNMISVFHDTEIFLQKNVSKNEVKLELADFNEPILNTNDIDDDCLDDDLNTDDFENRNITSIEEIGKNSEKENLTQNTNNAASFGNIDYKFTTSFKYMCQCGDCFLHKSGFRQHMQYKHDKLLEESDFADYSEEIQLKIPIGFPNNVEYVSSKATIRKNKLQCRICTISFSTEQEVKAHEEIHKTYICDQCGAAFLKKHYLADHLRIHSEERGYTCKICQKSFKHRYTFSVHKRCHEVERNFVCDTCGADFKTSHTLRTHIRIKHSNVRNYPCPNCNLRFNLKSTLDKHIFRKHTPDRQKTFVCCKCGAAYLNKNTLTRHLDEKHLGKAKFYPCTICENKVYVMKKGLKAHMFKKHGIEYQ